MQERLRYKIVCSIPIANAEQLKKLSEKIMKQKAREMALKEMEEINKREFENFQNQPEPTPEVKRPHRRKTFDEAFLSKKKKARKKKNLAAKSTY